MNPLARPIPSLRTLVREADLEQAQEAQEQARLNAQYEKEMAHIQTLDTFDDDPGSFYDLLEPDDEDDLPYWDDRWDEY